MKFQHIIEALYFQPWMITREGWSAIDAIVRPRLDCADSLTELTARAEQRNDDTDFFGNPIPRMEVTLDGVAIIPVHGPLIHHAGLLEKLCGACSYDDIRRDLDAALGLGNLNKILLDIASPGGMAVGCTEIALKIASIRESGVRIEARTDSVIGSAAYYLAAGCHTITCTPSSIVGSVGSYCAVLDQSEAFKMMGLKMELIKSGAVKGAGVSGTTLTDEQRADLQARVDELGRMFRDHVNDWRIIDGAALQGQAFVGREAQRAGFVDQVANDLAVCEEPYLADDLTFE